MDNPFPGMDPWMESQWGDAHHSLITFGREQLRGQLPTDLRARVEERVYLEDGGAGRSDRQPDLRVVEWPPRVAERRLSDRSQAVVAVPPASPQFLRLDADPATEGYIEIRERGPGGRVVTVIEVLSPANKRRGRGRAKYLRKQRECRSAGVNLVEVDLLRGGRWTVLAPEELVAEQDRPPYRVSVWRAAEPSVVEFYSIGLRERLPAVPVPLRPSDPDVLLDLQPLVSQAYVSGDYDATDYARPPVPKLGTEDAAWAVGVLRSKGLL